MINFMMQQKENQPSVIRLAQSIRRNTLFNQGKTTNSPSLIEEEEIHTSGTIQLNIWPRYSQSHDKMKINNQP